MNNTKKINDNGNTPAALTQTKKERERAELAAYLAAALPRCSLDTLRDVFTQVSNELPPEMSKKCRIQVSTVFPQTEAGSDMVDAVEWSF